MKSKNGEKKSEYHLKYEDIPLFNRQKKKKTHRVRSGMVNRPYGKHNDFNFARAIKTWSNRFRFSNHHRKSKLKK